MNEWEYEWVLAPSVSIQSSIWISCFNTLTNFFQWMDLLNKGASPTFWNTIVKNKNFFESCAAILCCLILIIENAIFMPSCTSHINYHFFQRFFLIINSVDYFYSHTF